MRLLKVLVEVGGEPGTSSTTTLSEVAEYFPEQFFRVHLGLIAPLLTEPTWENKKRKHMSIKCMGLSLKYS